MWQAIAPYKNRNPGSIDEEEYLENLFNSLCACLMSVETRDLFNKAEGALPTSNPLPPPPYLLIHALARAARRNDTAGLG
jgi:hypothetical protein